MLRITRRSFALVVVFCLGTICTAGADRGKRVFKVMTQNMDSGTDLGFIFQYGIPAGVEPTYLEVLASGIPARAARLADLIAAERPDLISLQEVTVWSTIPVLGGSATVVYDQLELLKAALKAHQLRYDVVAVNPLSNVVAPMSGTELLGLFDRDVVLARPELDISDVQVHQYDNSFPFGPYTIVRGFIAADVNDGDKKFRFVGTHLESTYAVYDPTGGIQSLQAMELIQALEDTDLPVVIAGDFNSNAYSTGPERTATVGLMLGAGFTDAWAAAHPDLPGLTWPLFLEDPTAPNPAGPYERIDLIFTRGLEVRDVQRVGLAPPYASDHTGVTGTLKLEP